MIELKEGDYFQVVGCKVRDDSSYRSNLFKVLSISNGVVLAEKYDLILSPSKVALPFDMWDMRIACKCFTVRYLEKSNCCCR